MRELIKREDASYEMFDQVQRVLFIGQQMLTEALENQKRVLFIRQQMLTEATENQKRTVLAQRIVQMALMGQQLLWDPPPSEEIAGVKRLMRQMARMGERIAKKVPSLQTNHFCRLGHQLQPFYYPPGGEFQCDLCQAEIPCGSQQTPETAALQCATCNFDLCWQCQKNPAPAQ
jgi:hypothetical protein